MRKRWMLSIVVALSLVIGVSCSVANKTTSFSSVDALNALLSDDHYTLNQVAYSAHPRQQLNVYLPKQPAANKAPIVFIYGGAWRSGERDDYKFIAHAFTAIGHPVIIPDYRLYPEVRFPAFVADVAAAIRYVEINAVPLLGQALQPYVLMGHSAGAHSAAVLAADRQYLENAGVRIKPAALIGLAGPYSFSLDDEEVGPIFKGATEQTAHPAQQVYSGMPPVLLLHGEADQRVYTFHSQRFDTALQDAGVPVKALIYPGVDHVRIVAGIAAPLRFLNDSYKDIAAFLAAL